MLGVAAMTQAGFAGNLRYVALPAALVAVLAGAGWVDLVRAAARRLGRDRRRRAGAPGDRGVPAVRQARARPARLRLAADRAGGRRSTARSRRRSPSPAGASASLACGPVYAGPFDVQALAWYLHLHGEQIEIFPFGARHGDHAAHLRALADDPRFPLIGRTPQLGHPLDVPDHLVT